jgi:hypothetical protein
MVRSSMTQRGLLGAGPTPSTRMAAQLPFTYACLIPVALPFSALKCFGAIFVVHSLNGSIAKPKGL